MPISKTSPRPRHHGVFNTPSSNMLPSTSATPITREAAMIRQMRLRNRSSNRAASPNLRDPRNRQSTIAQPANVVAMAGAIQPMNGARPTASAMFTTIDTSAKWKGRRVSSRAK